jgi:hypothetical protein
MSDPLLGNYPLPIHNRFFPLGFPLDLFTNSELIAAAAAASWVNLPQVFARPPLILRVGVIGAGSPPAASAPVCRTYRNVLSIHRDSDEFGVCDLTQGFGFAWLSEAVARESQYVRYFYIEAMAYVLAAAAYLAPVHAACIAWNDCGLLLCGESGAGKSSLAYACARAGWTYVTDDASFLVRGEDAPVVSGNAHLLRLRDRAVTLFPEFDGYPVTRRPEGKPSLDIETRTLQDFRTARRTTVSHALILNRNTTAQPSLSPFSKDEALRRWTGMLSYGDEKCRADQVQTLNRLRSAEILEFRYSDLPSAVSFLDATFRSGVEKTA